MNVEKERPAQSQNEPRITSLEIAKLAGKNHRDLMRSIRNQEVAWRKVNERNFALVKYVDAKGELRPMFELTKTESLYIISKFNDEVRAKLVKRWFELEQNHVSNILDKPINGVYPILSYGKTGYPRKEILVSVGRSIKNGYRLRKRFGEEHCFNIARTTCVSEELAMLLVNQHQLNQKRQKLISNQYKMVL